MTASQPSLPTVPSGHDADYIAGFNAGVKATAAVFEPTPAPPTPTAPAPPIVSAPPSTAVRTIQPNEDLVAILSAAAANEAFKLVAGATYTPAEQQAAPKASGWSLDATGATIDWTIPPAVATACLRLGSAGVKITGGAWKTNAIVAEILAPDCQFTNANIVDGATMAVKIDLFGSACGAGAIVQGNTIGITNSVSVYSTQPCQIRGNTFAASVGEVPLRIDCDSAGASPGDVIIDGNTIHSIASGSPSSTPASNQKGAVELRQLGAGCQFTNNTLYDYLRVGQGTATTPNQFANGLLIAGNNWPTLPPTAVQEDLMLMAGVTATVQNNDFLVNATMQTASVSAPTNVTFSGNRRHPNAAGIAPRPQLWDPVNDRAGGVPIDGGNNVIVPFGS